MQEISHIFNTKPKEPTGTYHFPPLPPTMMSFHFNGNSGGGVSVAQLSEFLQNL